MGLQFIDANDNERTLTEADMALPDFRESYSDLFKSLKGFRPRGEYFFQPDVMLRFFDTYEADMEEEIENERRAQANRKAYLETKHGRTFNTCEEAQRFNEQAACNRYAAEREAAAEVKAHKDELMRRGSPLATSEDWFYGVFKGAHT